MYFAAKGAIVEREAADHRDSVEQHEPRERATGDHEPDRDSAGGKGDRLTWDGRTPLRDENRRIEQKITTVAHDFQADRERLAPMPRNRLDPGLEIYPRVGRSSLLTVRQASGSSSASSASHCAPRSSSSSTAGNRSPGTTG